MSAHRTFSARVGCGLAVAAAAITSAAATAAGGAAGTQGHSISNARPLSYAFIDSRLGQLWKQNLDGTGRARLSAVTGWVASAAWSPRGDKLVLERHGPFNTYVEVVQSDGSHWLRLGQGAKPTWSPDGRRVAFIHSVPNAYGDPTDEVFVVNADGTRLRRVTKLTDVPGDQGAKTSARIVVGTGPALAWAPGGAILFQLLTRTDSGNLRALNPATGTVTKLTHSPFQSQEPEWSPDGRRIVFTRDTSDDVTDEIFVMNADGARERRLTTGFVDDDATWSPDGSLILFSRIGADELILGTPGPGSDIYVMRPDGSGKRRLTHNPADDSQPQWMPDGRISFIRRVNGRDQVMMMNADGSSVLPLGRNGSHLQPIWRPSGR